MHLPTAIQWRPFVVNTEMVKLVPSFEGCQDAADYPRISGGVYGLSDNQNRHFRCHRSFSNFKEKCTRELRLRLRLETEDASRQRMACGTRAVFKSVCPCSASC